MPELPVLSSTFAASKYKYFSKTQEASKKASYNESKRFVYIKEKKKQT